MKLFATDNSDLMEVSKIYRQDANLIVEGTIMGAMPIRAILKPAELRRAMGIVSFRDKLHVMSMLFRGSR